LSDRQAIATLGNADNDAGEMLAGGDGTDVSDRSEERNAGDERITRGVVEATDGSESGLGVCCPVRANIVNQL